MLCTCTCTFVHVLVIHQRANASCTTLHVATPTIILNFHEENFCDQKSNHKIHENIVPRNLELYGTLYIAPTCKQYFKPSNIHSIYQSSLDLHTSPTNCILYSWKIWWGVKFGGLVVCFATTKLKSANIPYSHIYVWQSFTEPPN